MRFSAILQSLSNKRPLVLVFDTCELLSSLMDSLLRRPLARRKSIATRSYVEPGERIGWRTEVDAVRFRIVPFDEDVSLLNAMPF